MCSEPVLSFKLHSLQLEGRTYTLLPKLTFRQLRSIAESLQRRGCSIRSRNPVIARSKQGTVRVTLDGLCLSSFDASDLVLPTVPDVLTLPKEEVPLGVLQSMYLRELGTGESPVVRLTPRLEYSSLWGELRRTGRCALAPDEHLLCTSLIGRAGCCEIVTDFPCDRTQPFVMGRKRYFRSTLDKDQALATLRVIGKLGSRNSYLSQVGALKLNRFSKPKKCWFAKVFAEMGEWCSFSPIWGESSNWRPPRPNAAPVV